MPLKIAQLGQPVLRQVAQEVSPEEIRSPEFQQLIDDMIVTMDEAGGVGLAGPQVFRPQRVFVAAVLPPAGEDEPRGVEVFINPRFTQVSEETAYSWEGCLSFLELQVLVGRHRQVRIEYLNAEGEPRALDLQGFPARVVQHEYDHLEGVLTIDRAPSTKYIIKGSEVDAFMKAEKEKAREDEGE